MKSIYLYTNHNNLLDDLPEDKVNISLCRDIPEIHYGYKPYDSKIQYLESTGTQWINTRIPYNSTNNNYIIECKFSMPSYSGSYDGVFGAYTAETNKCIRIIRGNSNNALWVYYNNQANSGNKVALNTSNTNIKEVRITSASTTVTENNTTNTYTNKTVNGTNTTSYFHLYCQRPTNGSPSILSKTRIYYFRIYDGSNLLIDLIPVKVGTIGYMFDKLSNQLFGNEGSGNFTLGPDI